ncbi:MAG: hypothetical protein KDK78_01615 [Chlamydiia bacterium]|nr:hypothetical protein [Chlamydiia bacterium]
MKTSHTFEIYGKSLLTQNAQLENTVGNDRIPLWLIFTLAVLDFCN